MNFELKSKFQELLNLIFNINIFDCFSLRIYTMLFN